MRRFCVSVKTYINGPSRCIINGTSKKKATSISSYIGKSWSNNIATISTLEFNLGK
nr:MAG TPA_asm: hypothetical protein [Caudoviricetes sp.]